MLIRGGKEYSSMFLNGKEYTSVFRDGKEYSFGEAVDLNYYPTLNEAVLMAMSNGYTLPPESELEYLSDYLYVLDGYGIFQKFDIFYMMLGNGDGDFKTINLADPSKFKGVLNGTLNINPLGIRSNGVSGMGYINTGMKILTNTTKMSGTNMSRGALITGRGSSTSAATSVIEGTDVESNSFIKNQLYLNNLAGTRISSESNLSSAPTNLNDTSKLSFYMASRDGATSVSIRYPLPAHNTTTGSAVADEQTTLLLRNVSGNRWGTQMRLGVYFAGSFLSDNDFINLRISTSDFSQNIGYPVSV